MADLIQYVRDRKRRRVGVMLARKVNDELKISFSLCNMKLDKFCKKRGLLIAQARLDKPKIRHVPQSVRHSLASFIDRAERYYHIKYKDGVAIHTGLEKLGI